MEKPYKKTLFIFRRDLRLEDNTALNAALQDSDVVIPIFIFTPTQIEKNPYFSNHCVKFMLDALSDLNKHLENRLYFFLGEPDNIVEKCIQTLNIDAVFLNRDYTPYSIHRDEIIKEKCQNHSIGFHSFDDILLHAPEDTLKENGSPYLIFTPFFKNALRLPVKQPKTATGSYFKGEIPFSIKEFPVNHNINNRMPGTREAALKILNTLSELTTYSEKRDYPNDDFTTHLSPYLKFTLISPRELHRAIRNELNPHHDLIRSLYWRDFFTTIAFFFPHVFQGCFHKKFDQIKWKWDQKTFQRWKEGSTGFPIVDAGMREMNETGFMHNRVRMITSSFLVKDLHIDWREGEKYFAQTLIDYDPAVNNGNWQWVAGTGCDAAPYFRIFNPWIQQKKFDPECLYIKKWVPELKNISPKTIHTWHQEPFPHPSYPLPIVDHDYAKEKINTIFNI